MSEISENEIKSMTKEQNYMRGYKDGKSDVLDKIKDELDLETRVQVKHYTNSDAIINAVLDVIDKYKTESEKV